MSLRLLILCDCNGIAGFGHFSRCLSLARVLCERQPLAQVTFAGRFDLFSSSLIAHYQFSRLPIEFQGFSGRDGPAILAICRAYDAIVIDSYDTEQVFIDTLFEGPCKVVLFDDMRTLDLSRADLVVCFRAGAEQRSYGAKKEALGLSYLVVKPELRVVRSKNLDANCPRPVKRILTFLSGRAGEARLLDRVVSSIAAALPEARVSYICERGKQRSTLPNVRSLAPRADIERLYASADLVVTGGGLAKYESVYCGIPNVTLSQTTLQEEDTRELASRNLTFDLGLADNFNCTSFVAELRRFAKDPAKLSSQYRAFENAIPADCTIRLADMILGL